MKTGFKDENLRVKRVRCLSTNIVVEERWTRPNGELHNPDGPAEIDRDPVTGIETTIGYLIDNRMHRLNGEPAYANFDPKSGVCTFRVFCVDGQFSRSDGLPHAEWIDAETGNVYKAEYREFRPEWDQPKLHRLDGPALLTFDPTTGEATSASFYVDGKKQNQIPFPELNL